MTRICIAKVIIAGYIDMLSKLMTAVYMQLLSKYRIMFEKKENYIEDNSKIKKICIKRYDIQVSVNAVME